ncbi:hypothetical protein CLIB1444_01S06458 [[Candida] jaroonii]|uniref:Uncharacterized protein n=1 Tax=[Candida] jaroonii TaxID=467808 RepID=A0ACA9Y0X2_9ASCO|nr:hypothetical protein CLIB1444_01S06458 [[Candida] jaroonii]
MLRLSKILISPKWGVNVIKSKAQLRYNTVIAGTDQSCKDYMESCRINGSSVKSTVFKGTLYEFATKTFLENNLKCFDIIRKGGAFDNGIDLVGKWDLSHFFKKNEKSIKEIENIDGSTIIPIISNSKELQTLLKNDNMKNTISMKSDINVLVQCKNHKAKIKASVIRELVGIYTHHIKTEEQKQSTIMMLVSPAPLTKQAQSYVEQTSLPLIHVMMSPLTLRDLTVKGDEIYNLKYWRGGRIDSIYLNSYSKLLLKYLNIELEFQKIKRLILV